jgi:threonine dehydratase
MDLVGLEHIHQAAELLEGVVARTLLEHCRALSERAGGSTYLKCENLQRTGAFKIRGAYNRIARLKEEDRQRGVVAASAGNHAQGVALAASLLGVKATLFMPTGAALPKVEATSGYGAEVVLEGAIYDEAFAAASAYAAESGAIMVHPFDHPDVIAGQGTIGLEILKQLPETKSIVVPVGGGGLISGIAAAAKAKRPDVLIIGVEPEGAANMSRALEAGKVVELEKPSSIADGLMTNRAGELTFEHVKNLVDQMTTVTDDEIAEGLLLIAERAKLVVEPAGAAGVAAVLSGNADLEFPAVILLSGGNIDPLLLLQVIRFGMGSAGRYLWFRTRVGDRPGQLYRLLGIIAEAGGNVLGVEHHREGARLEHLGEVEVSIQVETRGLDHVNELTHRLVVAGYRVEMM